MTGNRLPSVSLLLHSQACGQKKKSMNVEYTKKKKKIVFQVMESGYFKVCGAVSV